MITIKDFMGIVDYRITEGSEFTWHCFGHKAYTLDSWNGDHNGYSASLTFDTQTQVVYMMEVCDYTHNQAYRLVNPQYFDAFMLDEKKYGASNLAWDDVKFIAISSPEDMLMKAKDIFKHNQVSHDVDR